MDPPATAGVINNEGMTLPVSSSPVVASVGRVRGDCPALGGGGGGGVVGRFFNGHDRLRGDGGSAPNERVASGGAATAARGLVGAEGGRCGRPTRRMSCERCCSSTGDGDGEHSSSNGETSLLLGGTGRADVRGGRSCCDHVGAAGEKACGGGKAGRTSTRDHGTAGNPEERWLCHQQRAASTASTAGAAVCTTSSTDPRTTMMLEEAARALALASEHDAAGVFDAEEGNGSARFREQSSGKEKQAGEEQFLASVTAMLVEIERDMDAARVLLPECHRFRKVVGCVAESVGPGMGARPRQVIGCDGAQAV